jgi:hypothetical protein
MISTPRRRNWRTGSQEVRLLQLCWTHPAIGCVSFWPDMIFARWSLDAVGIVGCGEGWDLEIPIIAAGGHYASRDGVCDHLDVRYYPRPRHVKSCLDAFSVEKMLVLANEFTKNSLSSPETAHNACSSLAAWRGWWRL